MRNLLGRLQAEKQALGDTVQAVTALLSHQQTADLTSAWQM